MAKKLNGKDHHARVAVAPAPAPAPDQTTHVAVPIPLLIAVCRSLRRQAEAGQEAAELHQALSMCQQLAVQAPAPAPPPAPALAHGKDADRDLPGQES